MLQEFHFDGSRYRLILSQLKCDIKLQESSIYGLTAKIGKIYSKNTIKTQFRNGKLLFHDSISIPIEEALVYDTNPRKEKVKVRVKQCEVMLYRFYPDQKSKKKQSKDLKDNDPASKQKEKKNLIGMATVSISDQLFQQKVKTFRITNTFDKDALISCSIKISQNIFHQIDEKISSIGQKSYASSINQDNQNFSQKQSNRISQIVRVQKQENLNEKKQKISGLSLSKISQNSRPISTKQIGSFSERNNVNNYEDGDFIKTERMSAPRQEKSLGKTIRNDNKIESYSERLQRKSSQSEDNQNIIQLCNNLQDQNNLLMNKILHLQNHILAKNPSIENGINEQSKVTKSQSVFKTSMIKKNKKFTTSLSTTMTKTSDPQLAKPVQNKIQEKQTEVQTPKIIQNESNFSFRPPIKMEFEQDTSKIMTSKIYFSQKASFGIQNDSRISLVENLQVQKSLLNPFKIDNVISVAYTPQISVKLSEAHKSRIEKSISHNQVSFSRSYTKFNGTKRKYIESGHSKNSFLHEIQKLDFGLQTQIEEIKPKIKVNQILAQTPILFTINGSQNPVNFLMSSIQNSCQKVNTTTEKSNLQDVNQLIEQKYRKTEKYFKLANSKLLEQNETLKRQKKQLINQLQQKKHFSVEQFQKLQSASINSEIQVNHYIKLVSERDQEIHMLNQKLHQAHKENEAIQKDLREQKKTVAYFIKSSHLHDQKEKELQMKLKQMEEQVYISDFNTPSSRDINKSHILQSLILHSPRLVNNTIQQLNQNYNHLTTGKEYQSEKFIKPNITENFTPGMRFSVTKMTERTNREIKAPLPAQILTDRQKSVESKGLLNLKRHSALTTKRTIDLSRQQNPFQIL